MSKFKINIENQIDVPDVDNKNIAKIAELVLREEGIGKADVNIILVDDPFIIRLNKDQ